jgi:hypothetical protein
MGDLLIWAHKGDNFDFQKISVGETDTLILKPDHKSEVMVNSSIDLDLNVPPVRSPLTLPPKELIEENSEKIANENNLRQSYIESWMKPSEVKTLAAKLKIDTGRVVKVIARSMGNYKEISAFLSLTSDSLLPFAMSLLEILPDKDLRDVKQPVLSDHLNNSRISGKVPGEYDIKTFIEYILNPRIANEMLVSWRHYFLTNLPSRLIFNAPHNPLLIAKYLNDNIRIEENENYYKTPLTPVGVSELKISDSGSRAICFVAICRSLGIPSRLEPGRNVPQFLFNNKWIDVYFAGQNQPDRNKGYLKLHSTDKDPVPEYYTHFTIARFEDGRYNTLEYEYNKKITDFNEELPLPQGHYMLVTGNRMSDSRILSNISFFDLAGNEHKTLDVKIRKDLSENKILGSIDMKKIFGLSQNANLSEACTNDRRLVIIWVEPGSEPAKHIFNDLPLLKSEFDNWGGKFLFLSAKSFASETVKGLPANKSFCTDDQLSVLKNSVKLNPPAEMNLPVVVVTDKDGKIYFVSTGYRIGIGEQILKNIK